MLVPLALAALLVQSALWVPGYETRGARAPGRAGKLIEASIGDAKILNPILNADSSSSRVTGLVFDGLLDLDESLEITGRLATAWTVRETAYLLIDPRGATLADGTHVETPLVLPVLREALMSESARGPVPITAVEIEDARTVELTDGDRRFEIRLPPRIRLRLDGVDQDLLTRIRAVLGRDYGADIARSAWLSHAGELPDEERLRELVPLIEHNPEIEFRLRDDVRFHDGHPFDAGDVRFTYESIMDPRNLSPRTSDFEPIKAVEIVDAHMVRVVYKRLFSPAINAWTMGILPEHLLDEEARERELDERGIEGEARERLGMRDSPFNRAPVGTGPFRFVEWRSDEVITLERNDAYFEGPPLLESYHFRVLPDPLAQEIEFRTGAVDVFAPQPHQVAGYLDNPRFEALSSLRLGYTYIGYNARQERFADPRLRRALAMAIDVDQIVRYVVHGQGVRVNGPYARETPWYDPDVAPVPYDPEGAVAALRSLGYAPDADGWLARDGERLEFNLITNNGNFTRQSIAAIAQESWRRIGVKVNTQLFEWAVFLEDFINPGKFDAVILGWTLGIDADLYQLWHSSQSGSHQLNFVAYESPEADALIERIRREYDPREQQRLARELHRRIAADQPYTFLYAPRVTHALDATLAMVDPDGSTVPVRSGKGANVFVHMNRWHRPGSALTP